MAQTFASDSKLAELAADKVLISEKNTESLKDLAFGSIAGVAGKFVEFPFDTIKIRLQTQPLDTPVFKGPVDCFRQTVRNEGFLALYQGLSSPLVGAMLENAVLFVGYRRAQDMIREFAATPDETAALAAGADPSPLSLPYLCLSGAISGVFASMVLTPIELVKCKLQVQQLSQFYAAKASQSSVAAATVTTLAPRQTNHSGPLSVVRYIYTHHGLRGFYLGHFPTLLRETGGGAAWFGTYEAICRLMIARHRTRTNDHTFAQANLAAPQLMAAGAVAGMAYNFILFPADCIKSHMQTQDELRHNSSTAGSANTGAQATPRNGFLATGKMIYRSEGIRGLYRGCGITVVRAAPTSAIIFMTYELLSRRFA